MRSLIISLFILINLCVTAQVNYFNKQYDIPPNEVDSIYYYGSLTSVTITRDSGYIATGFSNQYSIVDGIIQATGYCLYCVRTDKKGNVIWQKRYPVDSAEATGISIITLPGDNYLIGGEFIKLDVDNVTRTNRDMYVIKLNGNGDTLWTKQYSKGTGTASTPDFEGVRKVIRTSDGGFAVVGYTSWATGGQQNAWLVKTDSMGNKQWEKTYGGSAHEQGLDIIQTTGGGFYITGFTDSYGPAIRNWYLVRTDNTGNQLWYKAYGGNEYNIAGSIIPSLDGNYFLAGGMYITSTDGQAAIIKIDANGNVLWEKKYGIGNLEDEFNSIIQLSDSSLICIGNTRNNVPNSNGWIIKLNQNGNKIWERLYVNSTHTTKDDYFYDIKLTHDDGFIMCGQTSDTATAFQDAWMVKTDCLGCDSTLCYFPDSVCIDTTVGISGLLSDSENSFNIYPNPNNGTFNLSYSLKNDGELLFFDLLGRKLYAFKLFKEEKLFNLKELLLSNGVYIYNITSANKIERSDKLIINKN